jgi:hypothetical protein
MGMDIWYRRMDDLASPMGFLGSEEEMVEGHRSRLR